jgi:hypothetical protein
VTAEQGQEVIALLQGVLWLGGLLGFTSVFLLAVVAARQVLR